MYSCILDKWTSDMSRTRSSFQPLMSQEKPTITWFTYGHAVFCIYVFIASCISLQALIGFNGNFAICNLFWFIASNSSRDKCLITYLLRISEPASRSQLKHWSSLKEKHWNYQSTVKNLFSDSKLKKDFNGYPGKLETKKGNLPVDTFQIYYK